ncbi:MAG: prepilin-type N-terminal cleavage/methylation domain-containing protein [Candidatus Zixiibacteriota bacterium]|nr:MAG: prepilin-type N-terminal cleavage/methylation domain-containing protein [candidate division Zixibacteria bacterium]
MMIPKNTRSNSHGFTLIEVVIALFITSVIALAGFQFFTKVSHQSEVQYDVSEMQNLCRISLYDIRKTLRSAGYMVAGPPYEINGDSLIVYYSATQPIDTTTYFLQEYPDSVYEAVPGLPAGLKLHYLMKGVNSAPPTIYADFISGMSFTEIDSTNVLVSITSRVPRGDDTYSDNQGFRAFTLTDRVNVRNVD